MKRQPVLAWLLIAVLIGVGWWGVHHAARQSLERGIARFAASLPEGARLSYASARPLLLMRGASLRSVVYRDGDVLLTIGDLQVRGFSGYPPLGLHLRRLVAHDVRYNDAATGITIGELQTGGVDIPPMGGAAHIDADPAAIIIAALHAHAITVAGGSVAAARADTLDLHDYALGHASSYEIGGLELHPRYLPTWAPDVLRLREPGVPPADLSGTLAIRARHVAQTGIDLAGAIARGMRGPGIIRDAGFTPLHRTMSVDGLHIAIGEKIFDIDHLTGRTDRTGGVERVAIGLRLLPHAMTVIRGPVDVAIEARIDGPARIMTIDRLALDLPGAGSLTGHASLDHLPAPPSEGPAHANQGISPAAQAPAVPALAGVGPEGMASTRLVALDLSYRDAGLDDVLIARIAAGRRMPPAAVRASIAQMAPMMAITQPALAPILDFVARPGGRTLHLAMAPPRPLDALALIRLRGEPTERQIADLGLTADLR